MIIALLQVKGGSGRTTLATNLAAASHLAGKRTLIVDLDRQGSALEWSLARKDGSKLDGLSVVKFDRPLTVPRLAEVARGYSVVFLDGPAGRGEVTQAAAVCADLVLTPVRPGSFDFWAVSDTIEILDKADEVREQLGRGAVRRAFVVNGAASGTKLGREAPEALQESGAVLGVVHNRIAFPEAASRGESVLSAPNSPASQEIQALWAAISKR